MKSITSALFLVLAWLSCPVQAQEGTKMRAQDSVKIRVAGVPDEDSAQLSATYTIDEDGDINLAYIGKVRIAGLTASAASRKIEAAYKTAEIFTRPNVTASVDGGGGAESTSRLIYVNGQVNAAKPIPFVANMRLSDAISMCGGANPFAKLNRVILQRINETTGKSTRGEYNIRNYTSDPDQNPLLQPGDRIQVP